MVHGGIFSLYVTCFYLCRIIAAWGWLLRSIHVCCRLAQTSMLLHIPADCLPQVPCLCAVASVCPAAEFTKTYGKKAIVPYCVSIAWSADGGTLFAGYTDGIIRVFTVSHGL
jgi:hypothetical protein